MQGPDGETHMSMPQWNNIFLCLRKTIAVKADVRGPMGFRRFILFCREIKKLVLLSSSLLIVRDKSISFEVRHFRTPWWKRQVKIENKKKGWGIFLK
jgi:hypothetical protein